MNYSQVLTIKKRNEIWVEESGIILWVFPQTCHSFLWIWILRGNRTCKSTHPELEASWGLKKEHLGAAKVVGYLENTGISTWLMDVEGEKYLDFYTFFRKSRYDIPLGASRRKGRRKISSAANIFMHMRKANYWKLQTQIFILARQFRSFELFRQGNLILYSHGKRSEQFQKCLVGQIRGRWEWKPSNNLLLLLIFEANHGTL